MNDRQRLQEAVVGLDRHAALPVQRGAEGLGLLLAGLSLGLGLGQLGRGPAKLLAHRDQLVFGHANLLLRLGQFGDQFLIVPLQRGGALLNLPVLRHQVVLLTPIVGHPALQHHGVIGAARQGRQRQGRQPCNPRTPRHGD